MKNKLVIVPPDKKTHREQLIDLLSRVFSKGGYFEFRGRLMDGFLDHSHYSYESSRVGILNGQIVTHWGVWNYAMRIGRSRVRVAGVGGVATHFDYRRRGFMERTASAGLEAMSGLGYDLSLLKAELDYYGRFGYVRAWPERAMVVRTERLSAGGPSPGLRKFTPRHRDDTAALYNRQNAMLTGTAVRPTFLTTGLVVDPEGYLWRGPGGKTAGYVIVKAEPGELVCFDHAGDPRLVGGALGRLARERHLPEVRLGWLHPRSDLAEMLLEGECGVEQKHHGNDGIMVRVVNLARTLRKMAPELSRRLKAGPMASWRGTLLIAITMKNTRQQAVLSVDRAAIQVSEQGRSSNAVLGGGEVAQLLVGSDEPSKIARRGGMKLAGHAPALIEALFPAQEPTLGLWDRF